MSNRWKLFTFIIVIMPIFLSGCGGKGSTKLSYTTPVVPLGISFSVDKDGVWSVAAGIATPFGTFAIEHSFETREEFTYIVMRNRERGTDQVFKINKTGFLDIHAIGEHKFRIQREGNKIIIDATTISGTLKLEARPSNSAIARIDCGPDNPDIVVTNDHKMIIEWPSMWTASEQFSTDSIKSVELGERWIYGSKFLHIEWRDGITDSPDSTKTIEIDAKTAEGNFHALQSAISQISPQVQYKQGSTYYAWSITKTLIIIWFILGALFTMAGK